MPGRGERTFDEAIEDILGRRPAKRTPLGGGCVGEVYRVDMADGGRLVAKIGGAGSGLKTEGWMLTTLKQRSRLPVPGVLHASDELLLMEFIESGGPITESVETHAAELLADLHAVRGPKFGLERETLIGGLPQPNPEGESWIAFLRDHRILYMGREAMNAGRLPATVMKRLEKFAGRLETWIGEPEHPSLIHGDMWGGNVLAAEGRITGFVDPAIYYADAEMELAFSTMFSTFGRAFFRRYQDLRPIRPGFFEERLEICNLYPLLVHVRLFGGGYVGAVERTLAGFGF